MAQCSSSNEDEVVVEKPERHADSATAIIGTGVAMIIAFVMILSPRSEWLGFVPWIFGALSVAVLGSGRPRLSALGVLIAIVFGSVLPHLPH